MSWKKDQGKYCHIYFLSGLQCQDSDVTVNAVNQL